MTTPPTATNRVPTPATPWRRRTRALVSRALLALAAGLAGGGAVAAPEHLTLMVGGIEKQIYLPVVLASRLGLFARHGVDVEVLTEPSGVEAEDELLAGAVDGVVGFYDHAIELQTKGKLVESVVQFGQIPGEVLLTATSHVANVRSPADLHDVPLGVTGLGSSTNVLVKYLATSGGVKVSDVKSVAVGAGDSFIDAMTQGRIAAGMTTEPTASRLVHANQARVVVDLRTVEGSRRALGGLYPAACLYMRASWVHQHPEAVRRTVAALLDALRWLHQHRAEEVADIVPREYWAGDRALYVRALSEGMEMFTTDGRMPAGGPENVLRVLRVVNPAVRARAIELRHTYTTEFVDAPRAP